MNGVKILRSVGVFLAAIIILNNAPDSIQPTLLFVAIVGGLIAAAIFRPPIAIAILLYYSLTQGGWLILAAAPVTLLLARRYQRQRLEIELSPTHIRRTVLLAMAGLVATLPFIGASLGPWSSRSSFNSSSASPLIPQDGSGEEGLLQRFARWLGFGDDGPGRVFEPGAPLEAFPVQPPEPDDPFNWWILVLVAVVVALLLIVWWSWRRRSPRPVAGVRYEAADPLARLEAVGESIGRPRSPEEGAITYGRELARQTGDPRFAAAGPLVSSQVYQSAFANPRAVDANLTGIEVAPPEALPQPSRSERARERLAVVSPRAVLISLLTIALVIMLVWVVLARLGDLESDSRDFRFALIQLTQ